MYLIVVTKDGERHQTSIQVPPVIEQIVWRYDNVREIQLDNFIFYPHNPSSALASLVSENKRLQRTIDALLNKAGV